ncbi:MULTISPECIES: hypothetical protein [unclassified Pseudarthrobacter]|uniref:hypothetical protein n=1 Tax=unclassified Pseudarthrobacter TaxID=2647000 RepID=UPI0030789A22
MTTALADLVSLPAPTPPPTASTPIPTSVPTPIPTYVLPAGAATDVPWWEKFLTGPPMAGLFALGAAAVAYRGILKQVAKTAEANRLSKDSNDHTRTANAETARKNSEDQWWSTLKWAYEEAKSFKTSAASTENLALVGILQNLGELEDISEFQRSSADRVIGIFIDSQDRRVRESAREASANVRAAISNSEARESYVKALDAVLVSFASSVGARIQGGGYLADIGMDWLLETSSSELIAVAWNYHRNPSPLAERELMSEYMEILKLGHRAGAQRAVAKLLVVTNRPLDIDKYVVPDTLRLSCIQWNEGDSSDVVVKALQQLMHR